VSDDVAVIEEAPKKRRGRRPKVQPPQESGGLSGEQFNQLLAVLAQNKSTGGIDMDALKEVLASTATGTAQAMQKAMKPENQDHPGRSCFSYPEGDKAKAKPVLPHAFFYNNYPFHMFPETQHYRELELAALVQPGVFTVMRKDFTPMQVEVKGDRDGDNQLTKVMVEFPVSREDKWKIPPQIVVLYQLVYNDAPKKRFVEAMNEYMAMFMGVEAA
jgi:hypothetical protein